MTNRNKKRLAKKSALQHEKAIIVGFSWDFLENVTCLPLNCCPPRRHRSSKRLWRLGRMEYVIESLRILTTIDRGSDKKKHIGQTRPTTRCSFSYFPRSTGSCSLHTRRRHFEKNDIKALSSVCRQAKKDSAGDQVPCRSRPGLPLHDLRLDRSGCRGDPACQSPRYA
jgi:hypothetical protein